MDTLSRLGKALAHMLRSRLFAVAVLSVLSAGMITYVSIHMHAVTIIDGDDRHVVMTLSDDTQSALQAADVKIAADDEIRQADTMLAALEINRAVTVHVTVDGATRTIRMTGGTVGDVLEKVGVEVGVDDVTNVNAAESVSDGLTICVERVDYQERTETAPIAYQTKTEYTNTLAKGRVVWKQKGQNGETRRVYRDRYIDGELVDSELVSEEVTEAVDAVKLVGTVVGAAMSPVPFDLELDAAGQPVQYRSVYTGKATAYTNDRGLCGTVCASGMKAQVGVVAVDPSIIPYGSKLYIVSPDGSYVYGYAIAGDTGGAAQSGRIVTDLFMNTYEECAQFGRRTMNVYVLE